MMDLLFVALASVPLLVVLGVLALVAGAVIGIQRRSFAVAARIFFAPMILIGSSIAGALGFALVAEMAMRLGASLPALPHPMAMSLGGLFGACLGMTLILAMRPPRASLPAAK